VDAHTFTKQAQKSLEKPLPATKLMATAFWAGNIAGVRIHSKKRPQ
jgi:hypothetical protein